MSTAHMTYSKRSLENLYNYYEILATVFPIPIIRCLWMTIPLTYIQPVSIWNVGTEVENFIAIPLNDQVSHELSWREPEWVKWGLIQLELSMCPEK